MAYDAGTAYLQITVSFRGIEREINAEAVKWGTSSGRSFADAFRKVTGPLLDKMPLGPSDPKSREQGVKTAGAFAEGFRARVTAALKSLPDVKIGADSSETDVALARIRADLAELSGKRIGVDVDETTALAELSALKTSLDDLGRDHPSVQVRADTLAASAELARVQAQVEELDHQRATVDVDASQAKTAAGDINLMAAAVAGLGPALLPIAGVAAAGLGGIVAAATAAGAGLGAFALVAKTDLGTVTDAAKKLEQAQAAANLAVTDKQRQSALQKEAALWASLSPSEAQAVTALQNFHDEWRSFAGDFQPLVFHVFSQGIDDARTALPLLTPVVQSTGGALLTLEGNLASSLGSPYWQNFSTFLGREAGPAITTFGTVLGNLGHGFAGLLTAFAPVDRQIEAGLLRLSQRFATFGGNAGQSSSFQSFLSYVREEGPQVVATVGNVATSLVHISQALAPLGGAELRLLNFFLEDLDALAQTAPGLLQVGVAMFALNKVGLLTPLVDSVKALDLGAVALGTEGVAGLGAFTAAAEADTAAVGASFAGLKATIVGTVGALSTLPLYGVGAIKDTRSPNEDNGSAQQKQLGAILDQMIQRVGNLKGQFGQMWYAASNGGNGVDAKAAIAVIQKYGTAQDKAQLSALGLAKTAKDQATGLTAVSNAALTASQSWQAQSLMVAQGRIAADNAANSQRNLASNTVSLASQLKAEGNTVSGLTNALDTLGQANLSARASQIQFLDAVAQANAQVKTGTHGLDLNTAAGRQNQQSLVDIATAAHQWRDAMIQQGASLDSLHPKLAEQYQDFLRTAEKMGATKDQAQALARQYGLLPSQVTTVVKAQTGQAQQAVDGLYQAIAKLHDKTIRITVDQTGSAVFTGSGAVVRANADGGIFPGYAPGVDSILTLVSPGESVLRPEATRWLGADTINALNRAAKVGALPAYADGGIVSRQLASLAYRPTPVTTVMSNHQLAAMGPQRAGGQFTGTLVLDSGEFLGTVRGEINQELKGRYENYRDALRRGAPDPMYNALTRPAYRWDRGGRR